MYKLIIISKGFLKEIKNNEIIISMNNAKELFKILPLLGN